MLLLNLCRNRRKHHTSVRLKCCSSYTCVCLQNFRLHRNLLFLPTVKCLQSGSCCQHHCSIHNHVISVYTVVMAQPILDPSERKKQNKNKVLQLEPTSLMCTVRASSRTLSDQTPVSRQAGVKTERKRESLRQLRHDESSSERAMLRGRHNY